MEARAILHAGDQGMHSLELSFYEDEAMNAVMLKDAELKLRELVGYGVWKVRANVSHRRRFHVHPHSSA